MNRKESEQMDEASLLNRVNDQQRAMLRRALYAGVLDQAPRLEPNSEHKEGDTDIFASMLAPEKLPELSEEILDLPDDATLIAFADGSLRGAQRASIQAVARRSVMAAAMVADFVREFAPLRALCLGWGGSKGPILYCLNRLPVDVTPQMWEAHMQRCARSRTLTQCFRFLSPFAKQKTVMALQTPRKNVRLAWTNIAGWGVAAVFAVLFFHGRVSPVTNPSQDDPTVIGAKNGGGATNNFTLRFAPTDDVETVGYQMDAFQAQMMRVLDNATLLAKHCRDQAAKTKDPSERRKLEGYAQQCDKAEQFEHQAFNALDRD